MNELQFKIIEKCYKNIKMTNRNDAAILGYCVRLAMSATKNDDGSISYCRFFEHRNGEQWMAEYEVDGAIKEIENEV